MELHVRELKSPSPGIGSNAEALEPQPGKEAIKPHDRLVLVR